MVPEGIIKILAGGKAGLFLAGVPAIFIDTPDIRRQLAEQGGGIIGRDGIPDNLENGLGDPKGMVQVIGRVLFGRHFIQEYSGILVIIFIVRHGLLLSACTTAYIYTPARPKKISAS
jgi:hypothetical protein